MAFLPGARYAISGTKTGSIFITDTLTGLSTHIPDAHVGPIWSISVRPDGIVFMSGGADKHVRFWDVTLSPSQSISITATLSRQLLMTQDILCLKYSTSKKPAEVMVAIGLLDSTTKLFYDDSLKFFLSLYGHKLPVMAIDMSYDTKICITGSADKTVKIWGMDFGDCHRSLIGHTDSVTQVKFQPTTHYFFSCSKDGIVKYWDADR